MEYKLRLHEEPFELIKNDIKHIEYRLNDEKRKAFKVGDILTFYKRPEEVESIKVKITKLQYYATLYEMYEDTFDDYLYKTYQNVEQVVEDTPYYTDEEIKKYGCVAIFIEKI